MNPYTNLTEALTGLICQGYNANFNLENNCLTVRNHKYKVYADEFYIEDSYHFEDPTPEYCCTIYVIQCTKYNIKGLMLKRDTFVLDNISEEMKEKLKII